MSDGQVLDSESFNKNYKVLKETADWLTKQGEPDIDQLVPKIETAMRAYAICKDRLDKVQETLGQYLGGEKAKAKSADDKPIDSTQPNNYDGEDDDIPF